MAYKNADRKRLEGYVSARICSLQKRYLGNQQRARALLASLRRGVSHTPGSMPEIWDMAVGDLPDGLAGRGSSAPTPGEWAAHIAFTLYAVHQQSLGREMCVRTDANAKQFHGLGSAVRQLAYSNASDETGEQLEQGEMPRRFAALVTAETIEEVAHYARQLVQQLKAREIPLDYGALAGQLYDFQHASYRHRTRLEWAREFAQWHKPDTEPSNNEQ